MMDGVSTSHTLEQSINSPVSSPESAFRKALINWLTSGEATTEIWTAIRRWMLDGGSLAFFQQQVQPLISQGGPSSVVGRLLEAAIKMSAAEEFADLEKIHEILSRSCCLPTFKLTDGHLRIEGAIVVMTALIEEIGRKYSSSDDEDACLSTDTGQIHTVSIYAVDCCTLDSPIDQPYWSGVNMCIVTRRLVVSADVSINLSGRSLSPMRDESARSSSDPEEPGADGEPGRAGSSSGSLCILAGELIGGQRLGVKLNGGRGEDGQNGGSGCRGADGVGTTEDEIRRIRYGVGERAPDEQRLLHWKHNWNTHYEFVDNKGRGIFYSRRAVPEARFLFIRGTLGEPGSAGGAGGAGGEGGHAGTCQIADLSANRRSWEIGSVERKRGTQGRDGDHGECGQHGEDGVDMILTTGNHIYEGKLRFGSVVMRVDRPDGSTHIPHEDSLFSGARAWAVIEEYTPERTQPEAPTEHNRSLRSQARAQPTLHSAMAVAEFTRVLGLSLSEETKSARPGGTAAHTLRNIGGDVFDFASRFAEEFTFKSVLGMGTFGIVFEAVNNFDKCTYAVKRISVKSKDEEIALREVQTMAVFEHPGIVRYYGTWIERPPDGWQVTWDLNLFNEQGSFEMFNGMKYNNVFIYIQMQKCSQSLGDWLENHTEASSRPLAQMKQWFKQIVSAVAHIHQMSLIHRDLKPSNILIEKSNKLKLCDLGITTERIVSDKDGSIQTRTSTGTPLYMSPEQVTWMSRYSSKIDIFSLGLILAELCVVLNLEQRKKIFDNYRRGISCDLIEDAETADLIGMMTQVDPENRPTSKELLSHPYLS